MLLVLGHVVTVSRHLIGWEVLEVEVLGISQVR